MLPQITRFWPPMNAVTRPWARWWWPGNAVDPNNLRRLLEIYQQAGIGGVEITPIYGVQGEEAREILYLSEDWLERLRFAVTTAHRLGLGVDMPTGSGWPFGGPGVPERLALDRLKIHKFSVEGNAPIGEIARSERVMALLALPLEPEQGPPVGWTVEAASSDGRNEWKLPPGRWTVYAASIRWSGRGVKRPAPGGEGYCINPFSRESLQEYLRRFDGALTSLAPGLLRCHFHDSFEYGANCAPAIFEAFLARRGYNLVDHLPALNREGDADTITRVWTDYRETLSELLLENFTESWASWTHRQGSLCRNQAHGSPGNLLDLYGAVDIPETEIFRSQGDRRISKFASSPAHVLGKPLVSSESCTWLGEHFQVSLADCKAAIDGLLNSGINHIFYHGVTYSPDDAAWPGWLFYASTDFVPTDPVWRDFPQLNRYVTRCQSLLQPGRADNDVLLYFPIHDFWQRSPDLYMFEINGRWFEPHPLAQTADRLLERGVDFDYISDRQLQLASVRGGRIHMPGGEYTVIVVPPCETMLPSTLRTLLDFCRAGATILFEDTLPADVPGLHDLKNRREEIRSLLDPIERSAGPGSHRKVKVGSGWIVQAFGDTDKWEEALQQAGVPVERGIARYPGLGFVRRKLSDGVVTFLCNHGDEKIDGWLKLTRGAEKMLLLDPMTGAVGRARTRVSDNGQEVEIQLQPGASVFVRSVDEVPPDIPEWRYIRPAGESVPLTGAWAVTFFEGGPELPEPFETEILRSWTDQPDEAAQRFAGAARYALRFDAPAARNGPWLMDLGKVCDSARVRLNGIDLQTLISAPYQVRLETLNPAANLLEIEVTNLAANRIRDMDRRRVPWKRMNDINFVNIDYMQFDASEWPLRESGLLGPVTLQPISG